MAMNPNMGMANMNPMGGAVGGAPMPMMNNGVAMNPQQAAAAAAAARQSQLDSQRGVLNTYIYEYFLRYEMFDCARSLLSSNQQVNVHKDGKGGNAANGEDPMDTDSKDDLDKLPDGLPPPKLPMPASDSSFLYEWFCLFWDIYNAQRVKGGNGTVNQYVAHTQSRLKQNQQQELLRQMRPSELAQQQYQAQMMRMQNGNMNMGMKQQNTLARAAMANNQNNPQMMMQPNKQNQMQRDPSGMDQNRDRPSSPASGENAPSPSKRQRIDGGAPFNPNQPGMVANGRPAQGMPGQQMANTPNMAAAHQMLAANGINPNSLNPQQLQNFINAPPAAQQKSIATYSQNLQQHHGSQMGNKQQMPNAGGPQNQGSPMMGPGPDGTALNAFYNPTGEMGGPGGIRPGPGGAQAAAGSNHALQDYQMQLMLLEQQNKKRLMMARQEQDTITGMPARDGAAPGAPGQPGQGPNGQPFPEASPQAMRSGASPNPADQMKRGTPQMNNSGIPSPVPEGGQSRDSPNPAMNFMGNQVDPNMAPHFFKPGTDMTQAQMNGMRPPSSHPGQPFNSQMNPQQMMAARQMQGQQGQQAGQGAPGQWQQGPNGQPPQGMQQNQQVQGTPQPRPMGPPSAPAATANANSRTTASPQQAAAAPPTPSQGNKPAPKKKETKAAKEKRAAAAKKASQNANAAGAATAGENSGETEATPATPITSTNSGFNKNAPNGAAGANAQATTAATAPTAPAAAPPPQAAPVPPQTHGDPSQNGMMDNFGSIMEFGSMELANPLQSGDVLNDFDFDSFLHEDNTEPFDFNGFSSMEGGDPIGAD
ncbi:hypothetical protein X797_005609 [Metarhizium robertsii]|uniref:Uncharacterized protein n=1 Tax=Metarhizium robertsii TaxID=568076 RepID=A0A014N470_9HYPO|nr:hypothetical protein X797_005609 [Metarhizium robertsii]